jgi:hypothetical protein
MSETTSEPITTTELDFTDIVNDYVEKVNPVVYILTPCFGSVCFVNYIYCLLQTKEMFQQFKIDLQILFCKSDSLITRARNNLVAKAMNDPSMTHMMFIDNDITWNPVDIIKLMLADKPLVGGIYPLKTYDFNKIVPTDNNVDPINQIITKKNSSRLSNVPDVDTIQMNLLKYNVNHSSNEIRVIKNLTKVRHVATGFMMIQRNVIEKMSEAHPETKYTDDISFLNSEENKFAYALFDCGVVDNHYLSEDWMFCTRWTNLNNEIWVDITINLTHTGIHDFKGCFMSTLV